MTRNVTPPVDSVEGYDYTQPGAYFVTIVTHEQARLFGEVVDGKMRLNQYGEIVREECLQTAILPLRVIVDQFIVMPNHIHAIIMSTDDHGKGTLQRAPTVERLGTPTSDSFPTIVRLFESATTKRINTHRATPGAPVWQRNCYEHVIRNEDAAERIREYIVSNPLRWALDRENPAAASLDDFDRWLDAQGHIPIPGVTK